MIILLSLLSLQLQAQNILNQGRSKIRKTEQEIKRAQRDYNKVSRLFSSEKKSITAEENAGDTIIWEKKRYVPQKGLVNDYAYLFRSIHGAQQKVKFRNTGNLGKIVWDSATNKYYNRLDRINAIKKDYMVMGWHPYWMKNDFQNYKYNLLSAIAYFSYDLNPRTGGYNDDEAISDWRTTAMIDSAQNHNVKVLLTVTSYGSEQNNTFLRDRLVWNSLVDSLKVLLQERNANGIDLDFEQIPAARRNDYTDFVKKLRTELGSSAMITLQVQAYNTNNAIDFHALDPFVDYFIIQGFDYSYVQCSGTPAPVAPLNTVNSNCPSITNTYDYCIRSGMNPQKAILGLPAYGTEWRLKGHSWNADASFERYITYDDVMSDYNVKYEPFYDAVSGSSYFFINEGANSARLVWYEGSESLNSKMLWALEHEMKGAAIWALGYDGGQSGIWSALASTFGEEPLTEIRPIGYDNGQLYSIMQSFVNHKRAIGIGVVIIVYFFIIGLFISLFDWRVREIFFQNFTYRAVFAGILIALSILAVFLMHDSSTYLFPLFTGLIIGAVIVYVITTRYISYRDKLP